MVCMGMTDCVVLQKNKKENTNLNLQCQRADQLYLCQLKSAKVI